MKVERHLLGTGLFIATEATFFAVLILGYLTMTRSFELRPGDILEPGRTLVFSLFLFASSATVWFASKGIESGNQPVAGRWLAATIVLAGIFLYGQASEYAKLFGEGITISRGMFGSAFFTLTGFHGAHVVAGAIALAVCAVLTRQRHLPATRRHAFEAVSLYWHFVDGVWIVILLTVYLQAVLSR